MPFWHRLSTPKASGYVRVFVGALGSLGRGRSCRVELRPIILCAIREILINSISFFTSYNRIQAQDRQLEGWGEPEWPAPESSGKSGKGSSSGGSKGSKSGCGSGKSGKSGCSEPEWGWAEPELEPKWEGVWEWEPEPSGKSGKGSKGSKSKGSKSEGWGSGSAEGWGEAPEWSEPESSGKSGKGSSGSSKGSKSGSGSGSAEGWAEPEYEQWDGDGYFRI